MVQEKSEKKARIKWPFPRTTLEQALKIPSAIKATVATPGNRRRFAKRLVLVRRECVVLYDCCFPRLRLDDRDA